MTTMVNQHHHQDKSFHLFVYLNEDIKATVLSFLADAPFECTQEVGSASSLTHKLPHVSQKFRRLASLDLLWKDAMLRQMKKEPFLWKPALHKMMQIAADGQDSKGEKEKESSPQELVEEAYKCNNCSSYKVLYQNVVTKHLRFKGPVFHMEGQVCLGEPYSLHFFEPRYRYLIAEIMRDFPEEAKHGGRIDNPPCFLHANRGPLAPTTPVTLVQVIRCEMFPDGRADVLLMPTAYAWIEKLWQKPNSGGLIYGQCMRMGQQTTHTMNQLARQEALTFMMDQLLGNLNGVQGDNNFESETTTSGSSGESDFS